MDFQLFSLSGAFICLMYFLAGFVDSVCGGGGLLSLPALMVAGVPTALVVGTNQCASLPGSLVALGRYMKSGRMEYRSGITAIPFAMAGSWIGSQLNRIASERFLQIFMIGMVPLLALLLFTKKDIGSENRMGELSPAGVIFRSALLGLVLGCYLGFYGPGGGMLAILSFSLVLKLDMPTASGTPRLALNCASVVSCVSYALSHAVLWGAALASAAVYILGSYLGAGYAIRHGSRAIRPLMIAVLILLFIKICATLLGW